MFLIEYPARKPFTRLLALRSCFFSSGQPVYLFFPNSDDLPSLTPLPLRSFPRIGLSLLLCFLNPAPLEVLQGSFLFSRARVRIQDCFPGTHFVEMGIFTFAFFLCGT